MDNYKELYYKLFNKITDIINQLQDIQTETEEIFILQQQDRKVLQIYSKDNKSD